MLVFKHSSKEFCASLKDSSLDLKTIDEPNIIKIIIDGGPLALSYYIGLSFFYASFICNCYKMIALDS